MVSTFQDHAANARVSKGRTRGSIARRANPVGATIPTRSALQLGAEIAPLHVSAPARCVSVVRRPADAPAIGVGSGASSSDLGDRGPLNAPACPLASKIVPSRADRGNQIINAVVAATPFPDTIHS